MTVIRSIARRGAIVAGLWLVMHGTQAATPPPVVIDRARLQTIIEEVPVSGTITSPRVAELSPAVAGQVQRVLVDAGAKVKQGQELLVLNAELARWALAAAAATTKQAREELADAKRRRDDLKRLSKRRAVPQTQVEALQSEVRLDTATVQLRQAEERSAKARLARYKVYAPFAGVISRKHAEAGEWVSPGNTVLELIAVEGLRAELRVPQAYFPRVGPDTAVLLRIDALGERSIEGRVGEIIPISDAAARTFTVRAYPQGRGLPLTPGMSASAVLRLGNGTQGVVVPRDAVLRYADGRITAWVVQGEGDDTRAVERQLDIGLSFDGLVVIRSGLKPGERVVVEGNEGLRPRQKVSIRADRSK